jgi:hypothetical protein
MSAERITMKAAIFVGSLLVSLFLGGIILVGGFPPLLYLMGVVLFLGATGVLIEKPIYIPSLCIALTIVVFIAGAVAYPRFLSATAETPLQHFQAAKALVLCP